MESALAKSTYGNLPLAIAVTAAVVVLPCALALALRMTEVVTSPIPLILLPVALSIGISQGVAAVWRRRASSSQLLFEDLMIWGWIRNRRFQRLLSRSETFVGPNAESGLTVEQRARKLEQLSTALEARDPHTHGHSRRVARHAATMAKRLKLPQEEIARIRTAALLHDVGKIETPREILEKPGKLTDEEYEVIKLHPGAGAVMVADLNDPELESIVRHHHERIDGGGYPDRLSGTEIPLGARIVAVADTFDALTSARPYRPARSHEDAIAILREEAGAQLDASAVGAFDSRYAGHRPVALYAAVLGVGRQLGQTLIGVGSGASQVAAVGAAAAVIGVAPAHKPPPDPVKVKEPASSRQAAAGGSTTLSDNRAASGSGAGSSGGSGARQGKEPGSGSKPSGGGPDGGQGGGNGNGGSGGNGGGSGGGNGGGSGGGGGGTDPGTGGGGSGGGGSPPAQTPSLPATPSTTAPLDNVPDVPQTVPGSGAVNNALNTVKEPPGKVLQTP